MAKNISYKKTTTEKISIKGILSDDATEITYMDDEIEKTIAIQDCLDKFASMAVDFSISCKSDENLLNAE